MENPIINTSKDTLEFELQVNHRNHDVNQFLINLY